MAASVSSLWVSQAPELLHAYSRPYKLCTAANCVLIGAILPEIQIHSNQLGRAPYEY